MSDTVISSVIWDDLLDDAPKWALGASSFLSRLLGGASIAAQVAATPTATGDGTVQVDAVKRAQGLKAVQSAPAALAVPSFEASRSQTSVVHDINPQFGEMPVMVQPTPDLLGGVGAEAILATPSRPMSARASLAGLNPWDDEYSTWGEEAVIGVRLPPALYPVSGGSGAGASSTGSRAQSAARPAQLIVQHRYRSQRRLWRKRRRERKGGPYAVYLGVMRAVTATYGAATEVQDLAEAIAWNAYDRNGRLAMMAVREAAFGGRVVEKGDVLGAMAVNARAYTMVMAGIADGTYRLDLGGTLFDYGVQQTQDAVIAAQGRAYQEVANKAGWAAPVGIEALTHMHERQLGAPDERTFDVFSPLQPWSDAFSQRLWWSSSRYDAAW